MKVLGDDGPRLIGVRVAANDLRGDHEGWDEGTVARRSTSGWQVLLEAGEQVERGVDVGFRQTTVVDGVRDENSELGSVGSRGGRGQNGGRNGSVEQRSDVAACLVRSSYFSRSEICCWELEGRICS